jgi:hypothetical protein
VAFDGEKMALSGASEEDGGSVVENIHVCTGVITGREISKEPSFDVLLRTDVITTATLNIYKDGTFYFVL